MEDNPSAKSKKPYFLAILFALFFIVISLLLYQNFHLKKQLANLRSPSPSLSQPQLSPSPTPNLTAGWNIYTNPQYEFEFKYPSNIFVKTGSNESELIVELSNDKSFDLYKMGVFDIRIYFGDKDRFAGSGRLKNADVSIQEILNDDLGYFSLKEKWGDKVIGNFFGNPPWSYYQVFIPHLSNSTGISFYIKTDISDDPEYGGTRNQTITARQILSTFKFLDQKQYLEKLCRDIDSRWVAPYNECENETSLKLTEEWCKANKGTFTRSSPCRHDEEFISGRTNCIDIITNVCTF